MWLTYGSATIVDIVASAFFVANSKATCSSQIVSKSTFSSKAFLNSVKRPCPRKAGTDLVELIKVALGKANIYIGIEIILVFCAHWLRSGQMDANSHAWCKAISGMWRHIGVVRNQGAKPSHGFLSEIKDYPRCFPEC